MCNWSAKLKHCNVLHYVLLDWVCVHRQDRHTDRKWHAVQGMFHKRFEICGELTFNFVFFFTLCFNNTCTLKFKSRLMIAHWLLVDRRPTLLKHDENRRQTVGHLSANCWRTNAGHQSANSWSKKDNDKIFYFYRVFFCCWHS